MITLPSHSFTPAVYNFDPSRSQESEKIMLFFLSLSHIFQFQMWFDFRSSGFFGCFMLLLVMLMNHLVTSVSIKYNVSDVQV